MNIHSERGNSTLTEIRTQADAWKGVFRRIDEKADDLTRLIDGADEIVFCGCGSAFNVSHAVAPVFQKVTEKTCRALHSSDLVLNPCMFLNKRKKTLVIAYSRSGSTTESVMALRKARDLSCKTIAVVCFEDSPMTREADESVVLKEAVERSVTTTRSLTSMVLSGYYLASTCTDNDALKHSYRRLPEIAGKAMSWFEKSGHDISENKTISSYAFVGSGSYYGLAREAQLKIKEMVRHPSDSYVSLDYQHGPMSNVDEQMLVSIMVSDSGRHYDLELARKMKTLNGTVLVLCDSGEGFSESADYLVELKTGLADGVRDVLYMPVLQFMAYYKSMATGNDPDNPKNLSYFVEVAPAATEL